MIKIYSDYFGRSHIVTEVFSSSALVHANNILCGLNISISNEKKNFTFLTGDDLNATPATNTTESTLIDATDKFFGVEPSESILERSEFYALDDDLTDGQKALIPRKTSIKQFHYLVALDCIRNRKFGGFNASDSRRGPRTKSPYFNTNNGHKKPSI